MVNHVETVASAGTCAIARRCTMPDGLVGALAMALHVAHHFGQVRNTALKP
jgi:hypothetical protein